MVLAWRRATDQDAARAQIAATTGSVNRDWLSEEKDWLCERSVLHLHRSCRPIAQQRLLEEH
eukprot:scaffold62056_cov37-Tisochrysis_lutea.AAC.2